jgi:hypothetical protein
MPQSEREDKEFNAANERLTHDIELAAYKIKAEEADARGIWERLAKVRKAAMKRGKCAPSAQQHATMLRLLREFVAKEGFVKSHRDDKQRMEADRQAIAQIHGLAANMDTRDPVNDYLRRHNKTSKSWVEKNQQRRDAIEDINEVTQEVRDLEADSMPPMPDLEDILQKFLNGEDVREHVTAEEDADELADEYGDEDLDEEEDEDEDKDEEDGKHTLDELKTAPAPPGVGGGSNGGKGPSLPPTNRAELTYAIKDLKGKGGLLDGKESRPPRGVKNGKSKTKSNNKKKEDETTKLLCT